MMRALSEGIGIASVTTRGVLVPLTFTLGTSAAEVRAVPLVLVDLLTDQGITGRSYVFCYTPAGARAVAGHVAEAVSIVKEEARTPLAVAQMLSRRLALIGVTGTVRFALSAIDIALWDALGVALQMPVAALLGAGPRPVRAHDSRGLGLMPPDRLAAETEALLAKGLKAIKLRLGHPTLGADLAAVAAVRRQLPDDVALMVDYNQALLPAEALARGRALEGEGIAWLEEPIRHDDYRSLARLARDLAVPVQIGENFNGPEAMAAALAAEACDLAMPDVARIGGVTGWIQAAGLAASHGVEVSSHLMPEISAQLLAATPTPGWCEYVDWADAFLAEPLETRDGAVVTSARPGFGLAWDEARLSRLPAL